MEVGVRVGVKLGLGLRTVRVGSITWLVPLVFHPSGPPRPNANRIALIKSKPVLYPTG